MRIAPFVMRTHCESGEHEMDVAINTVFGVMSFHGYTGMYMVGIAFYDDRHSV